MKKNKQRGAKDDSPVVAKERPVHVIDDAGVCQMPHNYLDRQCRDCTLYTTCPYQDKYTEADWVTKTRRKGGDSEVVKATYMIYDGNSLHSQENP